MIHKRNTYLIWFSLYSLGLIVSLLGGGSLIANWRAHTRGIPEGLPEPMAGTDVSPFCVNVALDGYGEQELDWALGLVSDGGFRWVRQTFPWSQIEPEPNGYEWELWDRIVSQAVVRELSIIAVLDGAPDWAGAPPEAEAFASFAAAFAQRYQNSIDYYQIWHNPNLADGWGAEPNPAEYAGLLQRASDAIRGVDPQASILLGSLAPTVEQGPDNLSEPLFLEGFYAAGGGPYFDILSAQPYGFDSGPDDRRVGEGILNFGRAILLREVMSDHGDAHKAVWASHFGWSSPRSEWEDVPAIWGAVDEETQASHTVAALERARREWPWMGALCLAHLQPSRSAPDLDSGTPNAEHHWGFALVGPDGVPRPVFEAVSDLAHAVPSNLPGAYTPLSGVAEWEGNWEFSELGADVSEAGGDRVSIPFWGTDLGLSVRRGDYRGYFYVTVDEQPADQLPLDEDQRAYLVLTSPNYQPQVTLVPVASGVSPGPHVAEIVSERGWDQWALAGWSVAYRPDPAIYRWSLAGLGLLLLLSSIGLVVTGRRLEWGALGRSVQGAWSRLSNSVHIVLTAATTALLWLAAWMTWGVEVGSAFRRLGDGIGITATLAAAGLFYYSPWFLLTLVAGLILFVLILLRLDLGLALVAALAPFYTFPWEMFDKAFSMAEIVVLMTFVSWGVRMVVRWSSGDIDIKSGLGLRALDVGVLLLVLVALVSPFFAEFQREAWRELRLVILEPAAFYLMLRTARLGREDLWRVADFYVFGGLAVAVIGLVQYGMGVNLITAEGGLARLRSVYGSPNNVGLYLGRVLPILAAVVLFAGHRRRRISYGVALLPVGVALLLSFSKGALILGVPAAFLVMGVLAGGRWLWATLGVIVIAGLAVVPLLRLPRFASLFDVRAGSTLFRLKLWQATVAMIRDHPWLGVGLDNFLYAYRGRYILPTAWQEPDLSHPHNFVLDHWARLGVFGLAAGVWLQAAFWRIALPLRRLRDPDRRALGLGLMGAVADMLAHGLVDHSFFLIDLAFAFFLILALAQALFEEKI